MPESISKASLISDKHESVSERFQVAPNHRQREENRYRMSLPVRSQHYLGDLLNRKISQRALNQLLTTPGKDQALTSGRRILDLGGENLSPVALASELKIDRNAFRLVHKAGSRKGILRNRIE